MQCLFALLRNLLLFPTMTLLAGSLAISLAHGQNKNQSVFAVEPIKDGGVREMPPLKGLIVEGKTKFSVPEGAKPLDFPNGNLGEVAHGWPAGGWVQFDPQGFVASVALLTYMKAGENPKPVDYAEAAGMPLGEYDFLLKKTAMQLKRAVWQGLPTGPRVQFVVGKGPGKTNLLHLPGTTQGTLLRTPDFEIPRNKPYFLSFWVRSDSKSQGFLWLDISEDQRSGMVTMETMNVPDTQGKWRRVGYFFDGRPDMAKAHVFHLPPEAEGKYVDLAGYEVRGATVDEMARAYAADRATKPANVTKAQPGDGANLGLSKAKLAGKAGVPGRPFVVWAIGSSFTNGLGRGQQLRQMVHAVYPNAPEIVYYARMGSGSAYDFVRGWAMTGVVKDQPDLVICHTMGSPEGLEEMLKSIRSQTTADIIIGSLHFTYNVPLTPQNIETKELQPLRDVCKKYGAQFVENRREMADWLILNNQEPITLLNGPKDPHQNALGVLLTNENIWRHLVAPIGADEVPQDRERIIELPRALGDSNGTGVTFLGKWTKDGDVLVSDAKDSAIEFTFVGNRLDILGETSANGGTLVATVDGKPLNKLDAYSVSLIQQPDTNRDHGATGSYPHTSGGAMAGGPHGVSLGKNIVPQNWQFEMIDNKGHFKLVGSETGPDGEGFVLEPFVSNSGQIMLDPKLWRYGNLAHTGLRRADIFPSGPGDYWPFTVTREVSGPISFSSKTPGPLDRTIFKLAPNQEHKVVLTAKDGPVRVKALVAYKPPFVPQP